MKVSKTEELFFLVDIQPLQKTYSPTNITRVNSISGLIPDNMFCRLSIKA